MRLPLRSSLLASVIIGLFSAIILPLQAETLRIDLTSALRLANEQNTDLAIQLERVRRAEIDQNLAWYQWLPTLRAGFASADQTGPLQSTNGLVQPEDRTASSRGLGLATVGSGLAPAPGFSLEVDLAKGVFQPLVARQKLQAARAQETKARHNLTLEVAAAYYELVQSQRLMIIAREATTNADSLAKTTANFAAAGEGLKSDSARAAVESLIQQNDLEAARIRAAAASGRLVQLLRLTQQTELQAIDDMIVPLRLISGEPQLDAMIGQALANHPELDRYSALVKAEEALQQQQSLGLLLPKIRASYSDSSYKGGVAGSVSPYTDRRESAVAVYWEVEGFGLSSWARKSQQESWLREAQAQQSQVEANIIADVNLALTQYRASGRQLELLRQAVDHARSSYRLSQERIFENQGLPLEALQAMKTLAEVEAMHLSAAAQRNMAQLYLLAATGNDVGANL